MEIETFHFYPILLVVFQCRELRASLIQDSSAIMRHPNIACTSWVRLVGNSLNGIIAAVPVSVHYHVHLPLIKRKRKSKKSYEKYSSMTDVHRRDSRIMSLKASNESFHLHMILAKLKMCACTRLSFAAEGKCNLYQHQGNTKHERTSILGHDKCLGHLECIIFLFNRASFPKERDFLQEEQNQPQTKRPPLYRQRPSVGPYVRH
jgi:hypothetical protein